MSINKKDIVKAAIVILLVSMLTIANYYLFPEPIKTTTLAYAFAKTDQPIPNIPLNESIFLPVFLCTEFTLSNKWISLPSQNPWDSSVRASNLAEYLTKIYAYNGELNGTLLNKIEVHGNGLVLWDFFGGTAGPNGSQPSGPVEYTPEISSYNITYIRHTIFNTSLKIGDNITNLGACGWWDSSLLYSRIINGSSVGGGRDLWGHEDAEIGATGYWGYHGSSWAINSQQLSTILENSGTAVIEFNETTSWNINYTLTTSNGIEKADKTLNWEGTLGTIAITYDQGAISWVKYDFATIVLMMLPISTP